MTRRADDEPDSTAVRAALWRALHVEVDAAAARARGPASACSWRRPTTAGATGPTWTRSAPAGSGPRSWPAPASSRTWWPSRRPPASPSTSSSAPGSTPSPSAGPTSAPASGSSRSTSPAPRRGSAAAWIELGYRRPRLAAPGAGRLRDRGELVGRAGRRRLRPGRPAVVASTGVSMYLTKDATAATLRQLAALAPGSTLAMTFLLPAELVDEADRPGLEASTRGARGSGTPFVSFYAPDEMLALARDAGFADARHVSAHDARRPLLRRPGRRPAPVQRLQEPQAVLTPLTAAAIFLVATIDEGAEDDGARPARRSGRARANRRVPGADGGARAGDRHRVGGVGPAVRRAPAGRAPPLPRGAGRPPPRGLDPGRPAVPHPIRAGRSLLRAGVADHGSPRRLGHRRRRGARVQVLRRPGPARLRRRHREPDRRGGRRTRSRSAPRTPTSPGSSYVIVQKYLHDLDAWNALSVEDQERAVGRRKLSNVELRRRREAEQLPRRAQHDRRRRRHRAPDPPRQHGVRLGRSARVRHLLHRLRRRRRA